ncbi:hypothetical protein [Lacticaseibacillus parakribbianus]|uniref:hypothetical protein n=1 Tax=Lacticaseibacillus parakribbianus TaxID=2970927 RepID=UPI0021CB61D0|nr:hypothetical protein [Lacticaseibacillus parakribbianus]
MDQIIYVVYYDQPAAPAKLIKGFRSRSRALEYQAMLAAAPFPGQRPAGYRVAEIHLN